MQVLLLFISLAIWCSAAEEAPDPYYFVTVSSFFTYPSERKSCVVLSQLNCAVNLKLEFVTEDSEVKQLVEDKIDEPEHSQCYSFQVPALTTDYADWDFRVSINGDNVNISESTKVVIYKGRPTTFVQTDKPLYKPGQSVNFRVVILDEDLYAHNETISMVEIKDPNGNQIAQWRDVKPVKGIADLSFQLADEVPPGEYNIIISHKTTRTFSVTEYELKNFVVDIHAPDAVHGKDDSFPLDVCARYNFGKPVHGFIKICVCISNTNPLDDAHYDDHIEHSDCQCFVNLQTDSKGCFRKDVDLHFFNLATTTYIRHLTISTAVKEHDTGRVEKTSTILQIGSPKMSFVDIDFYYHKGIAYTGMLYVLDTKRNPKANVNVFLIVNNDDEKTNVSLVTNEKGIARFSLDTSDWKHRVSITGAFDLEDDSNDDLSYNPVYRWLYPFYSASNSFLKLQKIPEKFPCDVAQPVKVKYSISKNDLNPDSHELKIYYLFSSYGNILASGEHILNIKGETSDPDIRGSFSINLKPKQNSHSHSRLLVYTLLKNGAVTGDQALYRISMCFKHKVKLEFSEKEVHPRGKVKLDITADPGSMCSVRSVDKGLLLVKSHDQFIDNSVDDMEYETFWWEHLHLFSFLALQDTQTCSENDPDSEVSDYSSESRVADMSTMFLVSHILLLTNAKVRKPVSCPVSEFSARSSGPQTAQSPSHSRRRQLKKPITRKFIPETWIFDLVSLGDDGHTQLSLTTPDAITKWETDAFCLSNDGYGQAQKVHLKTIQPFFTDIILPHSVMQGEIFTVTVQVFNYLENCMMAMAWLSESEDFIAVRTTRGNTSCICPDQSETFTWNITVWMTGKFKLKVSAAATKLETGCPEGEAVLGNKDVEDSLEKTIIVKPGGVKNEVTKTYRLCPGGGSVRQEFVLKLPEYMVPGSEYADLTVFGDILSNAVFNSEDVIDLPTGCGEQNSARFAVNLELLRYLKKSNQRTLEIKKKLLKNLTTGYQKQLSFRNENGSYSIFPDDEGNIWLTAKVVREFSRARDFIHINEKNIQDSLKWLSSAQLPSGCFQRYGDYFNRWQEDKEHEDMRLAAFISIALMESGASYEFPESVLVQDIKQYIPRNNGHIVPLLSNHGEARSWTEHNDIQKEMLQKAMTFLKKNINDVNDTSTEAVLAYAFTLSGDEDLRKYLLEDLEREAKRTDLDTHWEDEFISGGNIETSAYVVLTLLTHQPTSKDIEEATKIINWIVSKQDSRGGYYSTADTVLALQALSKFAESTVIQKGDGSVSVRSRSGFQKQFVVDKDQGILLQKASLPDLPGEYVVTVTGEACVYVQTHLHYYVPVVENDTHFALNVSTWPTTCTYQAHTSLQVIVELSYTGTRASSNMVIVEVNLMSGFKTNKNNLAKLLQIPHVKRTEIKDETVILYLDKLTHDKLSLAFSVTQESYVDNLQPATVRVYDYYEPDHHAEAEYISPCHTGGEVCHQFIGCFSGKKPWTGTGGRFVRRLPWSAEEIGIRFLLYTRQNPVDFQVIHAFNASSISASNFNSSKKSQFIIHGFISKGETSWLTDMCTAILSAEDVNCFCVDWHRGANTVYTQAANNVRVVGAVTAYFIDLLVDTAGYSLSDVYLIGHSLGAQAAGEAGKRRPGISRITGLDPAGPYFEGTPPEVRLDRTDAKLVDVIHTDGSSMTANMGLKGYGTSQLLGHLDFFPNGGIQMKGCGFSVFKILRPDLWWQDADNLVACDHLRSYKYFTESISHPEGFVGFPADSYDDFQLGAGFPCPITGCPLMGYYADTYTGITSKHQVFYLNTAADPPYTNWRYEIIVKEKDLLPLFQHSQITIHGSLGETEKNTIDGGQIGKIIRDNMYIMYVDLKLYLGDITKMVFNGHKRRRGSLPSPLTNQSVSIQFGKDGQLYNFCGNESLEGNTLTLPFC